MHHSSLNLREVLIIAACIHFVNEHILVCCDVLPIVVFNKVKFFVKTLVFCLWISLISDAVLNPKTYKINLICSRNLRQLLNFRELKATGDGKLQKISTEQSFIFQLATPQY